MSDPALTNQELRKLLRPSLHSMYFSIVDNLKAFGLKLQLGDACRRLSDLYNNFPNAILPILSKDENGYLVTWRPSRKTDIPGILPDLRANDFELLLVTALACAHLKNGTLLWGCVLRGEADDLEDLPDMTDDDWYMTTVTALYRLARSYLALKVTLARQNASPSDIDLCQTMIDHLDLVKLRIDEIYDPKHMKLPSQS